MRLSSAFPNDPLSRQDVAKLVMELMQGHEDTLGAYSPTPRAMVKIAASHWRDHPRRCALRHPPPVPAAQARPLTPPIRLAERP